MGLKQQVKRLEQAIAPPFQGEPDILLINLGGKFCTDSVIRESGRGVQLYHNEHLFEEEGVQARLPVIVVFIGSEATEESVLHAIEEAKTSDQLNKNGYVSMAVGMNDDCIDEQETC